MLSDNFVFSAESSHAANAHDASLNTLARPLSLADEAHRQLLSQLEMNLWRAGDKLPPEKALAASLGVSRPVIREALARLKADGRVESRQGSGAYVADRNKIAAFRFPDSRAVNSSGTPTAYDAYQSDTAEREMLELRQIVESGAAELAAVRRNEKDMEIIRAAVAAMDVALERHSDGSDADDAFHNAIAVATHNRQISKFVEFLGAQFSASRKVTWGPAGYGVGIAEVGHADHRAILVAIADGNAPLAKRLAHSHVQRAIDRVIDRIEHRGTNLDKPTLFASTVKVA